MCGHEQRVLGRDAGSHGLAHHPVDVPRVGDVLGVAVVRAERDPPGAVLLDEREQREEVARHRGLADQQPHPCAQPLAPFLDGERLVVRVDACGRVGLEVGSEDTRRVAVDMFGALEAELLELRGRTGDDAREVHHLREAENAPSPHQGLQVTRGERSARRLERRGGNARRRHEEHVELETRGRVQQPVHAVHSEDVRHLVRVSDDGRRSQREHEPRELVDHELHGLEVHVGVDEAGDDVLSRRIHDLGPVVRAEARDDAVDHRDVDLEPLACEDREHLPAPHDEIRRLVPATHREAALQRVHEGGAYCPPHCRIVGRSVGRRDRRSR
jgi:hypothetical protein